MSLRLRQNESLQITYRQSEILLVKPVLIVLLALYLPWFFFIKYEIATQHKSLLLIWTLLVGLYGLISYIIWRSTLYTVTTQRLVISVRHGIFRQSVTETPITEIQNISSHTTGALSIFLDYGTVEVHIEGASNPALLERVRDPEGVKDYLWQLRNHLKK